MAAQNSRAASIGSPPQEGKYQRRNVIKEAIGELIGPTEIAPEVMILIKAVQNQQKALEEKVHTCNLQFKSLEGLRLERISEELNKHDMKLQQ